MHFCADELIALMTLMGFIPGFRYLAARLFTWRHKKPCKHGHKVNKDAT